MAQSSRMPSSASATPLLAAHNLSRRFGETEAVRDVTLALERGSVLGLLGVNGAGKTTTLKLLAGVLAPDRGEVRVLGRNVTRDARARRELVAYAPERPALHRDATPRELISYAASLRNLRGSRARVAVDAALERGDLEDVADRLVGRLSRGQQQRVGLAQSLVHAPALVLLDEPTAGLDPMQAAATRAWIADLRQHAAVIVSTHLLGDVRACCDEVAVLHGGSIAFSGPLDAWLFDESFEVRFDQDVDPGFFAPLSVASDTRSLVAGDAPSHWWIAMEPDRVATLSLHAAAQGVGIVLLRPREDALEQRFVDLVAGRTAPGSRTSEPPPGPEAQRGMQA